MEKVAWTSKIKEGKRAEYVKRHDEIWQELKDLLTEAGIVNYTIWEQDYVLFGYYECTKGKDFAQKIQANSEIVDKWNEYMADLIELEMDKDTGAQPVMTKVFELNCD